MDVIAIVSIFSIIFAYIGKTKHIFFYFGWIIILFIVSIRTNFGNDFELYEYYFEYYSNEGLTNILKEQNHQEVGWIILNKIFSPLGFNGLLATCGMIEFASLAYLIKKYVPAKYWWFSVFIFTFNPNLFLIQLSMMRQAVAMILVALAFDQIVEKKMVRVLFLISLAFLFHQSSLFVSIFLFVPWIKHTLYKKYYVVGFGFLMIVFATGASIIAPFVTSLLGSHENLARWSDTFNEINSGASFGIGAFFKIIFAVTLFYNAIQEDSKESKVLRIASCSIFIIPLILVSQISSRLEMYFEQFYILAIPILLSYTKLKITNKIAASLYILYILYMYNNFSNSLTWSPYFTDFHTIFD